LAGISKQRGSHPWPIHDKLLAKFNGFGKFEEVPKKAYASYRRKKQYASL